MKIAILLKSLGNNQVALNATNAINTLAGKNYLHDITIFYEEINQKFKRPICSSMNISELWNFSGFVIFTEVNQFEFIRNIPQKINSVFYVQNLDWFKNYDYEYNYKVFSGNVIARSDSHADAIERFCGKRPNVQKIFDLEKMCKI